MVTIKNECCDCKSAGFPCRGDSCPLLRVESHTCDNCGITGDSIYEPLYFLDGEELCQDCLLSKLERTV